LYQRRIRGTPEVLHTTGNAVKNAQPDEGDERRQQAILGNILAKIIEVAEESFKPVKHRIRHPVNSVTGDNLSRYDYLGYGPFGFCPAAYSFCGFDR
jgi:hypothetical protein